MTFFNALFIKLSMYDKIIKKIRKCQMKIQKIGKKYFVLLISILFLFVSLWIRQASAIRIILCLFFILGILFFLYKEKKVKKLFFPLIFVLLFLMTILGDAIISYVWKRIPIFSYNITSTENTRVYNAFGITVWQCDKKNNKELIVEPFYKKGYLCEAENLKAIDSNDFLKIIIENYEEYQNTKVKIKGRISKKGGLNYVEMKPFTEDENGTITFQDSITLSIIFENKEEKLTTTSLFDEIEVIGVVKTREIKDNEYIVYLHEARLVN